MGQIGSGGAPSWCNGLSGEIQMDHIGGAAREPGCQWQIDRGPRDIACLRRSQKRYATRSAPYHQNITLAAVSTAAVARALAAPVTSTTGFDVSPVLVLRAEAAPRKLI